MLAETSFDLNRAPYKEFGLGDLITDAYRLTVSKLQPDDPPVIAVEANGSIRADVRKGKTGNVWFADLFRVTPLGIGPNAQPGYPLVTYYLHGRDLKAGLEVAAGADTTVLNDDAYFLQISGMEADFDKTQAAVPAGDRRPAQARHRGGRAHRLRRHHQVLQGGDVHLPGRAVRAGEGGQRRAWSWSRPRKRTASRPSPTSPRASWTRNPATPAVDELKAWQALAGFVSMLPDNPDMTADPDTVPDVPAAYQAAQGRIKITP